MEPIRGALSSPILSAHNVVRPLVQWSIFQAYMMVIIKNYLAVKVLKLFGLNVKSRNKKIPC